MKSSIEGRLLALVALGLGLWLAIQFSRAAGFDPFARTRRMLHTVDSLYDAQERGKFLK